MVPSAFSQEQVVVPLYTQTRCSLVGSQLGNVYLRQEQLDGAPGGLESWV
jgi:hypothetical protein